MAPAEKKASAETLAEKKTGVNVDAQHLQKMKGKIIEYVWHLKKQGYKDATLFCHSHKLEQLVKLGANLFNPESVKVVIAQ